MIEQMSNIPWYEYPQNHYAKKEAIIIGAGIAGTSAAMALAKREWRVTLIERDSKLATGASGNNAGIIMPLITHHSDIVGDFYLQAFLYTTRLLDLLRVTSAKQCGVIKILPLHGEFTTSKINMPDKQIQYLSHRQACEIAGANLSLKQAIYLPKAGWVNPIDVCHVFASASPNLEILTCHEAITINKDNQDWIVSGCNGTSIKRAPVVVIANAFDALHFKQCHTLPMQPIRGQLTYLPANDFSLDSILCYDGYVIPKVNNQHVIGATYHRHNTSLDLTDKDHLDNITRLQRFVDFSLPEISSLKGRASIRCATPDRRPCVGQVPDINMFQAMYKDLHKGKPARGYSKGKYYSGLYMSVGHGSRGLVSAPLSGEYLATLINNEPRPFDNTIANLLHPARFVIRNLKRG